MTPNRELSAAIERHLIRSETVHTTNQDIKFFGTINVAALAAMAADVNSTARFIERAYVSCPFFARSMADSKVHQFLMLDTIRVHGCFFFAHEGLQFILEHDGQFYCAGYEIVIRNSVPLLPAYRKIVELQIAGTVIACLPAENDTVTLIDKLDCDNKYIPTLTIKAPVGFRIFRSSIDYSSSGASGYSCNLILSLLGPEERYAAVTIKDTGKWLMSQGHID